MWGQRCRWARGPGRIFGGTARKHCGGRSGPGRGPGAGQAAAASRQAGRQGGRDRGGAARLPWCLRPPPPAPLAAGPATANTGARGAAAVHSKGRDTTGGAAQGRPAAAVMVLQLAVLWLMVHIGGTAAAGQLAGGERRGPAGGPGRAPVDAWRALPRPPSLLSTLAPQPGPPSPLAPAAPLVSFCALSAPARPVYSLRPPRGLAAAPS